MAILLHEGATLWISTQTPESFNANDYQECEWVEVGAVKEYQDYSKPVLEYPIPKPKGE